MKADPSTLVRDPSFRWRQSLVADYLRCPRAFALALDGPDRRHDLDGWAALIGDAAHATIAKALRSLGSSGVVVADQVRVDMQDAFLAAIRRVQDEGHVTDPESVEAALERVEEQAVLVAALVTDPRVTAIEWRGIEEAFELDAGPGRRFVGTRDAWGVARRRIEGFGADGQAPVTIEAGECVLVDWKTGQDVPVDHVARALNVQLAVYRAGLPPGTRAFLGLLRDLERPVRPRADGSVIPAKLKEPNPAWQALVDQGMAPAAASRRAKKWLERPNPDYTAACERPRGAVFHESRTAWSVVSTTIADVIDAARAGIYPASGAATGQCRRCEFRADCASYNPDETTKETR